MTFALVSLICLIFFKVIPPRAAILIFHSLAIRLNLMAFNILFFEYLGLKNIGDKVIREQFCPNLNR